MAFAYRSKNLGLKNPFKLEGKITAIRGALQSIVGITLLVLASGIVKEDAGAGWVLMLFGVLTRAVGIKVLAGAIYANLRFFVGRNHPTSLAKNYSKSERSTSQEEANDVAYSASSLEEMLVGRKNSTFVEPVGFLSRLLHSFFPKLLFLPYPIRNMAQRLFGAAVSTLVALIAYGLVAFVSLAGFAGEGGELAFPIYSAILMIYILLCWRKAGKPIPRSAEHNVEALGSGALAKIISLSFILPVAIGLSVSWLMEQGKVNKVELDQLFGQIPNLNSGYYLVVMLVLAILSTALISVMVKARATQANPIAEVSELRENWQESVHPNEIFINLDNLVMANRRYKEVPNRVYRELDPSLEAQIEGKGGFSGELIHEVQPKVRSMALGDAFTKSRLITLLLGNAIYIAALVCTVLLAYSFIDIFHFFVNNKVNNFEDVFNSTNRFEALSLFMSSLHILLIGALLRAFAQLLTSNAHLFFAEMQFESLLVYFKCEGTFTESKISTGKGINDSTQSENILVRSSITPWVIVSKVISTTFAATGMKNLEHPRHIIELHKDDNQLAEIKADVVSFLKDRESIASITSERDLGNASQLYQLNEQTRAKVEGAVSARLQQEQGGAYIKQQNAEIDGK